MPGPEPLLPLAAREDDEGIFSRDINGQLVRLDAPTEADYAKEVTLQIDGHPITVPLSEPLKDANGNIVLDIHERTTPRYTTIYDAAVKLFVQQSGAAKNFPIPILCHQPHMKPVAVCRVCVVQIYGQKRGQRAAERRLLPACQHQVKDGMEVFTMNAPGPDGERVRNAVKVVTELLQADHLKAGPTLGQVAELARFNELANMTQCCGAKPDRFQIDVFSKPPPAALPRAGRRPFDASSPVFVVDHSACILCDRCVRACDEVMQNNVIGRTGKGITAGIGFDLNDPMGESSCVQCGECMISCPTTAITFKPVAQVRMTGHSDQILRATELMSDRQFAELPPKFLLWQEGLAVRHRVKAGDLLCREGDPGNTAFIIKSGTYEVALSKDGAVGGPGGPKMKYQLTEKDTIFGEMACLSGRPRTADVMAMSDGELWEIRRNVLDRFMRLPRERKRFEQIYRERALQIILRDSELFKAIPQEQFEQILDYMRQRLSFVQLKPGQTLFRQGDPADALYFVRLGYLNVSVRRFEEDVQGRSRGPGTIMGEIGLLAFSAADTSLNVNDADVALERALKRAATDPTKELPTGTRSATCSALGEVELARLGRNDFLQLLREFPVLRRRFVVESLSRLKRDADPEAIMPEYVAQGLYEGRSLLVLDLDLCTRCDECTKGCVEQHGTASHGVPITRLFRDGMRFDNYVVATSCRSCINAHCMVGCPVDAIHRGKHMQIVIEDHCIGCGLCATNCPYGSIFMMPNHTPGAAAQAHPKAATCDLCDAKGERDTPRPRCVSACPHEAAERITGDDLLKRVSAKYAKASKPKASTPKAKRP